MPNRIIKESIKSSPEIDKLSWFEEVVFNRLIVTVDDYGCFDGRVIVLKNALFPTKDNVTKKAIEDAIRKLERVKLLECYEADGKPYIHLTTWEEHQRIRNKHRKYPIPTLDSNSLTNDRQMSADCQLESESNHESNPESESYEDDIRIKEIVGRLLEMGYDESFVDETLNIFNKGLCPHTADFYQKIVNTMTNAEIYNKEGYIYRMAENEVKA